MRTECRQLPWPVTPAPSSVGTTFCVGFAGFDWLFERHLQEHAGPVLSRMYATPGRRVRLDVGVALQTAPPPTATSLVDGFGHWN